jgi:long-chain fatty acid transport protein
MSTGTRRILIGIALLSAFSLGFPGNALATDGYFLRGVGAVSTAMGGTGVAWSGNLLGAFSINPAGLARFDTTRVEVGLEMFRPSTAVTSGVTEAGGRREGSTSSGDWSAIPAVAFSTPISARVVLGASLQSVGAFGVDYPAAAPGSGSANPILAPQPFGMGAVYSRYSVVRLTPALAWKINENLWLGVNAHLARATMELRPIPFAAFQPANVGNAVAFFPGATESDGAWGTGMGVGLTYRTGGLQAGFNYQTPMWFETFEWGVAWPIDNLPELGAPASVSYQLNHPAVAGFGAAYAPTEALVIAVDARRIMYGKAVGFEPADPDQAVAVSGATTALGWKSVWEWGVGGQFGIGDALTLRAGYSHRDGPVPDELTAANVGTPAVAQDRISAGLGLVLDGGFAIDAAYARSLSAEATGRLYGLLASGASGFVTSEVSQDQLLVQIAFTPGSR